MLVSIIVPVYKVEEFLPNCVDSILAQTYGDFELILVDDGSPDQCGAMCDSYAKKYKQVRVLHKENGGLSSARNAGLEVCKGEYIAFVDSDDAISPYYLEVLLEEAIANNADIVQCEFEKSENIPVWTKPREYQRIIRVGDEIEDNMFINDVPITVAWNKLYKRKIFLDLGLRYPIGRIHEDMFLTPKILYYAERMVIIDEPLYFYRERSDSIMSSSFSLKKLDKLYAIEETLRFFEEKKRMHLVYQRLDGYIRNLIMFYGIMHRQDKKKYRRELHSLKTKIRTVRKKYMFDKKLSYKNRLKLLLWRCMI